MGLTEKSNGTVKKVTMGQLLAAWSVHLFTMSGVIFGGLAIIALVHGHYLEMWGWLAVCLVVDGVDGTLARRVRVREVIPWFDGVILDSVVDYLSWTFIPALFMYKVLPWSPNGAGENGISFFIFVIICTSSMFCYCNTGMKSSDFYFVGFPAAWNIVALYLYLLQSSWITNIIVVIICIFLTVMPITFCHPFRVKRWRWLNLSAVSIWLLCSIYLTIVFPDRSTWVQILWWISGGWFMTVSAIRTYRARSDNAK